MEDVNPSMPTQNATASVSVALLQVTEGCIQEAFAAITLPDEVFTSYPPQFTDFKILLAFSER